ncbi:hypothetical protein VOLCADRAFT_78964 [Volvox carteri f. nagariensis]|uniref:Ubiquinone biosynthesis protein n=1 Tax=Volvox carteri f. nagariensis TaxID=3068 RepID=D8TIQ3_VOLCA|nr:uncharacterized protein VOLCADRAFT_78964 [Volvox carteri f. nagariensis]EFJ52929.1 hypothetical protein VOLCADRAFT_78964 [Volvox carteri f. nagariensis]|eukprot:XP_002945934.1 hypothetical protein VOLCADRAFT_78964 [Volvox carteri f. nagariensis]
MPKLMERAARLYRQLVTANRWHELASQGWPKLVHHVDCGQASTSGRPYSSSPPGYSVRYLLLDGALKHVAARGWTDAALIAAARDLGLSPAVIGLLPRGEGELVEQFMEQCNSRCIKELEARKQELAALALNERVAEALQMRLEMLKPVIDVWPQALAVAARPSNAAHSAKLLFSLVDDIWAMLGDGSTDVTWYSKRAILAGVYASTSLYMIVDYTPGFQDTWEALRRRVDEGLSLDLSLKQGVRMATSRVPTTATTDSAQ